MIFIKINISNFQLPFINFIFMEVGDLSSQVKVEIDNVSSLRLNANTNRIFIYKLLILFYLKGIDTSCFSNFLMKVRTNKYYITPLPQNITLKYFGNFEINLYPEHIAKIIKKRKIEEINSLIANMYFDKIFTFAKNNDHYLVKFLYKDIFTSIKNFL